LAVVLWLSESHAIINDLDVIFHDFMIQIIYTTVFRVKRLNNFMLHVRLFNRLTRKTVVQILLREVHYSLNYYIILIDWCLTPTLAVFQLIILYNLQLTWFYISFTYFFSIDIKFDVWFIFQMMWCAWIKSRF
jgi:hypothetical protein